MSVSSRKYSKFRDSLEKRVHGHIPSYSASPDWCTGISIFQGVAARFSGVKMSQIFLPSFLTVTQLCFEKSQDPMLLCSDVSIHDCEGTFTENSPVFSGATFSRKQN